jgi:hypothetical protein
MSATKLTETQRIILSAAVRRADRCVMLPPHLKGGAAQRVLKKLVDLGLFEEVRAGGDLPVWRRDQLEHPKSRDTVARVLDELEAREHVLDVRGLQVALLRAGKGA